MKIVLTCLLLYFTSIVKGQALKIGDKVPDVYLASVMNDSRTHGNLSLFRKKLTILDFWGTGCSACIEAFPHLDKLQSQFPEDLQIITVLHDTKDSLERFLRQRKKIRLPAVPFVTGDTILARLFPYPYFPHHIWIDSAGIVRYITEGYNATPEHVAAFLEGKELNLRESKVVAERFFDNLWDLTHAKSMNVRPVGYTLLTPVTPGTNLSNALSSTRPGGPLNRITCHNNFPLIFYQRAFEAGGQHRFIIGKTIEIRTKDSGKLDAPADRNLYDDWINSNAYSYELAVPEQQADQLFPIMQNDLARYFGIHGRIEKQLRPFLVLEIVDEHKLPRTRHNMLKTNLWQVPADTVKFAYAYPFEGFATYLKGNIEHNTKFLFLNDTHFKEPVDLRFPGSVVDDWNLKMVNQMLFKFGLVLTEKELPTEVLVLE